MPLIVDDDGPVLDSTRLSFRERLRSGRVVPIVSDEAVFNRMMGGYQPFLASYAPVSYTHLEWSKACHGQGWYHTI